MRHELYLHYDSEDMRILAHYRRRSVLAANPRIGETAAFALFSTLVGTIVCSLKTETRGLAIVLGVIFVVSALAAWRAGLKLRLRRIPNARSYISVVIDKFGLNVAFEGATRVLPWEGVERVIELKRGFVFELPDEEALFIPRRSLSIEQSARGLRQLLADSGATHAFSWEDGTIPRDFESEIRFQRLERAAKMWTGIGWVGGMTLPCILLIALPTRNLWIATLPLVAGYFLQTWATVLFALARRFNRKFGLVGLLPIFGMAYVATRARPEPFEWIDRDSVNGFLTTPPAVSVRTNRPNT